MAQREILKEGVAIISTFISSVRNFERGGGHNFHLYFKRTVNIFRQNKFEAKKSSWGSGGMLPRKIFENLHAVMAILVLLNDFQAKFVPTF